MTRRLRARKAPSGTGGHKPSCGLPRSVGDVVENITRPRSTGGDVAHTVPASVA